MDILLFYEEKRRVAFEGTGWIYCYSMRRKEELHLKERDGYIVILRGEKRS